MNPYPFVGLNHFTVPVAISVSNVDRAQYGSRPGTTRAAIGLPAAAPTDEIANPMLSPRRYGLKMGWPDAAGIPLQPGAYCKL